MNIRKKLINALFVIGILLSGPAVADLYVFGVSGSHSSNGLNITTRNGEFFVPVADSGFWGSSSGHDSSNKNYFSGTCVSCAFSNQLINNYFTFDLSEIKDPITSASLNLFTYIVGGNSVNYRLFDISSSLSEVHGSGINVGVYNDLMSGVSYGSFNYKTSDIDQFRSITLNSFGISGLNHAIGGEFGIGGTVTGGAPLPIPEPETYSMLLAGLGLISLMAQRRKNKISLRK